jgi:alkylated DNA repair dioxygenase AlkB
MLAAWAAGERGPTLPHRMAPVSHRIDLGPDVDVVMWTGVWTAAECAEIEPKLAALQGWERRRVRTGVQHRDTCAYADAPGRTYRYSGLTGVPDGDTFPEVIETIRARACASIPGLDRSFGYALCNLYRDGADHLGWHAGDETDLTAGYPIVSASFGAARFFDFRRNDGVGGKVRTTLPTGSVVVMAGATQKLTTHCVPTMKRSVHTPRYNVTLRAVVS